MLFRIFLRYRCASLVAFSCIVVGGFSPAIAQRALLEGFAADDGAFLDDVENQRALSMQVLQSTIAQQLTAARKAMDTEPDQAVADLKRALETIQSAATVSAEVRAQLRDQVVDAIQQAQRQAAEKEQRDQQAAARRAAGREQARLISENARRQEKLAQILARYNTLLDEGRYRQAEEAAYDARDLAPRDSTTTAAILTARTTGYVRDVLAVREARQRGVVDALSRVEQANVPFGDEPPIMYANPQVWEELTLRRRKYAAMSLDKQGSAEERIFNALNEATTMEFIELPLEDVLTYVADLHGIEVQMDRRALELVGIGSDTPITRNLKGISLRSAMKLMLRELDLTYTVRDEVLLITTAEEVENNLSTKVYPVADLVLPITGAGSNPFQMGGGLGGAGGFGGQGQQGGGNQNAGGNFPDLFANPGGGPVF